MDGIKFDQEKPKWHLLPLCAIGEIVKVLTFGAKKYKEENWKQITEPKRYWSACLRHLTQYQDGEQYDQETGLSHLAHAGTNIIFMLWFEMVKGIYVWKQPTKEIGEDL